MRNSALVVALLGFGTLVACGSANTPEVGSGTGAGTAGDADAGPSNAPGAADGGTLPTPTPPLVALDAGHTVTADGGPRASWGIGGTPTAQLCGNDINGNAQYTCAIPGELCCYQGAATPGFSCGATCPIVAPGKHPGSAALACNSAANCGPGLSCCVHGENGQTVSRCEASCATAAAQLCEYYADPAVNGCPVTAPCSHAFVNEFGLPATYGTCGGVRN